MKEKQVCLCILLLTLMLSITEGVLLARPRSKSTKEDIDTSFRLKTSPIKDTSKLITQSFSSLSKVASHLVGISKYEKPQFAYPEKLKQEVTPLRDSVLTFFNGLFRGLQNDLAVQKTECSISTENLVDEVFINVPIYLDTLTNGESPQPQELVLMFMSMAGNYQGFYKDCEIAAIFSSIQESSTCAGYKMSWRSTFNFTNMIRSIINFFGNLVTIDIYNSMIHFGDMIGILIAYEYSTS